MICQLFSTIHRIFCAVTPVLVICLNGFPGASAWSDNSSTNAVTVIAGTSWIATIVQDVTDGAVTSETLIPPAMCPGHFDIKPSTVKNLHQSSALLIHKWQERLPNVQGLLRAGLISPEKVKFVLSEGNWQVPDCQVMALKEIAEQCAKLCPEHADQIRRRARERTQRIDEFATQLREKLSKFQLDKVSVLSQEMQAPFVKWLGLHVAGTFARGEDISAADMIGAIKQAREASVRLVIDNLQSGDPETGMTLARELGVSRVVLTNFPGGLPSTERYEDMVVRNVTLILEALGLSHDLLS